MNKSDLVDKIAQDANLTKAQAKNALHALLSTITDELKQDGEVVLVGFGRFQTKKRASRPGRNPQTGETITIAAANMPVFKAGIELKNALR